MERYMVLTLHKGLLIPPFSPLFNLTQVKHISLLQSIMSTFHSANAMTKGYRQKYHYIYIWIQIPYLASRYYSNTSISVGWFDGLIFRKNKTKPYSPNEPLLLSVYASDKHLCGHSIRALSVL